MTIVVGVAAPDGLVLAADSRTTLTDGPRHRIATDSAEKLFAVCERFCIATWGAAFVDGETITGLMDEFVSTVETRAQTLGVSEVADELCAFFEKRMKAAVKAAGGTWPADAPTLGFLVAGYPSAGKVGELLQVDLPAGKVTNTGITTGSSLGVIWHGQIDVITRIIKGVDLVRFDPTPLDSSTQDELRGLEYARLDPITVQDAVDFASFLVRTTVDAQRFTDGTFSAPGNIPGCGGDTLVAIVTRSKVQWVTERLVRAPSRAGLAEGALGR